MVPVLRYQAVLTKERGGYWVRFPDLPGCFSQGRTRAEAVRQAREALLLYLEEARAPRFALPKARARRGKRYVWISARVRALLERFHFRARYSRKDRAYVATCDEFQWLSWVDKDRTQAVRGIWHVVADVVHHRYANAPSDEPSELEVDVACAAEARRRLAEVRAGKAKPIPWRIARQRLLRDSDTE